MTKGPIVVINPNSNEAVTAGLSEALAAFRFASGPEIECLTLAEGPFGIESQVDADTWPPALERKRFAGSSRYHPQGYPGS